MQIFFFICMCVVIFIAVLSFKNYLVLQILTDLLKSLISVNAFAILTGFLQDIRNHIYIRDHVIIFHIKEKYFWCTVLTVKFHEIQKVFSHQNSGFAIFMRLA